MEILDWIERVLAPRECNSVDFIYDDMESQSGRCLPVIYQPFDISNRMHWRERGAALDFMCAVRGRDKRLLDFGPGDGWPSLIVAPWAREVVGVDGSRKRVEVCTGNAERLGISNARFIHVEPGASLPFESGSFDGAMAASSVEQTPDPKATLREILRVLRPGGRFRILYEDLDRYRNGRECDIDIEALGKARTRMTFYDRHADGEYARMYNLVLAMTVEEACSLFSATSGSLGRNAVTVAQMEKAMPAIVDTRSCRLTHPSGKTFASWLGGVGFSQVVATHDGPRFAGSLFDLLPERPRPADQAGLDIMLEPLVGIVVDMRAPIESNPALTAIK
jgi:ubiquinone/menaquinone biosynthesis C-methylase UbiE